MPVCNECGNERLFDVDVIGVQTHDFSGKSPELHDDSGTIWEGVSCNECGSGDVSLE